MNWRELKGRIWRGLNREIWPSVPTRYGLAIQGILFLGIAAHWAWGNLSGSGSFPKQQFALPALVGIFGAAALAGSAWEFRNRWLKQRLRDRKSRGLCAHCRYDLRGTPGGVCPECGKHIWRR